MDKSTSRRQSLLVNVLGVVGVGSIALALLSPSVNRATPFSYRAVCQSNLKHIGFALQQYAQDNDGRLPGHMASRDAFNTALTWKVSLLPYLGNKQWFACPSNGGKHTTDAGGFPLSYACNGASHAEMRRVYGGGTSALPMSGRSLTTIPAPARTIAIAESGSTWEGTTLHLSRSSTLFTGHLGTANFLFIDGHVRALKPLQTASPNNLWNVEVGRGDNNIALKRHLRQWQKVMKRSS